MTLNIKPFVVALAALLSLADVQASANDPVPPPVRVSQVTFSQGTALTNDDGSAMPVPQWLDMVNNSDPSDDFPDGNPDLVQGGMKPNNVHSYAYSYVSNKKPQVDAMFKWRNNAPPPEGSPYWAEGKVVNTPNCSFTLPLQMLYFDMFYPPTVSPENIVDTRKIQAYVTGNRRVSRSDGTKDHSSGLVPVTIEWTVYNKDGKPVGTSQSTHTIYVTWDEPSTARRQETIFNLSCVMADGLNGAYGQNVCRNIFGDFKDKEVVRMDGEVLKFWGPPVPQTSGDLLIDGTQVCAAWSMFFRDSLAVHGYASQQVDVDAIRITLPNGHVCDDLTGWLVNDQTVTDADSYTNGKAVPKLPNGINRGQGLTCDKDSWSSHTIAKAFGELYDPSYGLGPSPGQPANYDQDAYENEALPGFKYRTKNLLGTSVEKYINKDGHSRLNYDYK